MSHESSGNQQGPLLPADSTDKIGAWRDETSIHVLHSRVLHSETLMASLPLDNKHVILGQFILGRCRDIVAQAPDHSPGTSFERLVKGVLAGLNGSIAKHEQQGDYTPQQAEAERHEFSKAAEHAVDTFNLAALDF